MSARARRRHDPHRRRQPGQPAPARAQARAAGTHRRLRRERRRGARPPAAASRSTCCCSTSSCPSSTATRCWRELQADPHLRDIPVIVTSALDELDSVVRCIEIGAEDYLTKPVNPVLLNARINASLEKKRLRDQQRELISRFATTEVAQDLQHLGLLARRQARRGVGDVLRHPRVHADRGVAEPPERRSSCSTTTTC